MSLTRVTISVCQRNWTTAIRSCNTCNNLSKLLDLKPANGIVDGIITKLIASSPTIAVDVITIIIVTDSIILRRNHHHLHWFYHSSPESSSSSSIQSLFAVAENMFGYYSNTVRITVITFILYWYFYIHSI
jgi:hypothetical protein